jgi:hypothetical protein
MLPDWPETKDEVAQAFVRFIRLEVQARLGLLSEIGQVTVHEGDGTAISRADGSSDEQGFTQLGAEMQISEDEFAGLPLPRVLDELRGVADQLARARSEHACSVLGAAAEAVGNVVDAAGGSLTADFILRCWETVEIAFDEHGRPQLPTIVLGPGQEEALRQARAQIAQEPELRRRAEDIIRRKREQWLAREADRTLAG